MADIDRVKMTLNESAILGLIAVGNFSIDPLLLRSKLRSDRTRAVADVLLDRKDSIDLTVNEVAREFKARHSK